MKRRYLSLVGYLTFTLILFGCTDRNVDSGSIKAPSSSVASSDPATDKWLGQWNGPEGAHFFGLKVARVGTKSPFRILTARELTKEGRSVLRSSSSATARMKPFARQVARKLG